MRNKTPLSIVQVEEACPSAFHKTAHPNRSERYVHLPTSELITSMMDNGYGVSRAQQKQTRSSEAMNFTRHLLAFRPVESFDKQVIVGDATPEILLVSSHDGTTAFRLFVGMFRFVCANGLMAGDTFANETIYHRGDAAEQMVTKSDALMQEYVPKLKHWVETAQDTDLTSRQQNAFAEKAMQIRHGKDTPYDHKLLLHAKRDEDKGDNVWRVYNRVQENLMQGGIEGRSATGRRSVLRPINRVTKDVTYNQQLWDLASTHLKEAA